jgi:hypothetical protein
MTADQSNGGSTLPPATNSVAPKRWRVELADKTARTVAARGFRVEHGALVLVQPAGCATAYASSTWLTIEALDMEGSK